MTSTDMRGKASLFEKLGGSVGDSLSRYALPIVFVIMFFVFHLTLPGFADRDDIQNLFTNQAPVVILAIGIVFPLALDEFDLSIGTIVGLGQAAVIALMSLQHWPILPSIVAAILCAGIVGIVNGFLVVRLELSSPVATLATGSVCTGTVYWITNGTVLFNDVPDAFLTLGRGDLFGIQLPIIYAIVIAVATGIFLGSLPAGRRLYTIGGNRRAAELIGIHVRRNVLGAFVVSAVAAGTVGVISGATLASAAPDLGPALLLPAYAGAFLGATAFKPGQFNVPGAVVGVCFLATASSGLLQMGVPSWSVHVFNGLALAFAVGLSTQIGALRAGLARRRRLAALREQEPSREVLSS